MLTASQARVIIGKVIKEDRGGVYAFATASGVHFTSIYNFLGGGGMNAKNAALLRGALPELGDAVWDALRLTDGFAPLPAGAPAEEASPL